MGYMVVGVNITKVNGHTREDAEDAEDVGEVVVKIDWVDDKFYEPGFYANFLVEENTRLHELRNNGITTTPANKKLASVESWLL